RRSYGARTARRIPLQIGEPWNSATRAPSRALPRAPGHPWRRVLRKTSAMLDVPRFTLGPSIIPEQHAFLREHGFVLFAGVATPDEVAMLGEEMERIESAWLAEGRKRVFGIPLFFGKDETGRPFLQRLAFTSVFSER